MLITPELQAELGDAAMLLDGDTVYLTNGSWLLVVTGAQYYFDAEIMDLLHAASAENPYVNWLVMTAKSVDVEMKKFVPARGRRALPIWTSYWDLLGSRTYYSSELHVTVSKARATIENYSPAVYGDDLVDLSALFNDGKARAVYATEAKGERMMEKVTVPEKYVFEFDGRVMAVKGPHFRAFHALGMQITTTNHNFLEGQDRPPLGMYLDVEPPIFGYINSSTPSGIVEDFHGRSIYQDACIVSWIEPDAGMDMLRNPNNYWIDKESTVAARIEDTTTTYRGAFTDGVGTLRWHGLTDEQIEDLYADGRTVALEAHYASLLDSMERTKANLENVSIQQKRWEIERVEHYARVYEALCNTTGVALDSGVLPELLDLVDVIKEEEVA